jgi:cysteinyl-tRNA synthetase
MHNGLLRFTGEKMSKSVGNIATIREVLDRWGRETTLLFFMTAHWRKPVDFSDETMNAAATQVESLRNALRGDVRANGDWAALVAVLEDDFNTPAALALAHDWAKAGALLELLRLLQVFGLGSLAEQQEAPPKVVRLAESRQEARAGRDYTTADRLREEILAHGWEVRDVGDGFELVPTA